MNVEAQTKRRWLIGVLESVAEPIALRSFPKDRHADSNPRPGSKGLALRLKAATRQAVRVAN